ncbi:Indigoidine synthase A like protein-domain-containing protein [Cercophora newfieldiana]|uniref:Indigoidine synthase A like protein-domain-containing protein n=1 Tax=Cercophora newfieldiana TaxID=92897 RepID=A0AA39YS70_9PEZI|nr:Indigoidine synthase A like protein-domain-containing protein [Cercophora newfieldiana]
MTARLLLPARALRLTKPSVPSSRRLLSIHTSPPPSVLHISPEVKDALATNRPVVALESTIYTHGALGDDLAAYLEQVVRDNGGVPATCGVLAGVPTVGLTPGEVERMVKEGARKVSRRDFGYIVGMGIAGHKIHGGTTISGTMVLARRAGIRVFGTGGLGGVHRGGENSLDISADLTELGRTRVAVISAGCKGFLDIPRTLEYLETQGVTVSTFADGRTGDVDYPAFWARESGTKSPFVVKDEKEAAAMILAQEQLGIESSLHFANPIPEQYGIPKAEMDAVIETAVREAGEKGISGARNTPYILTRIRELTRERSTTANVHLVRSSVERATNVAVELAKLMGSPAARSETAAPVKQAPEEPKPKDETAHPVDVLVAGSIALDLSCDYAGGVTAGGTKTVSPSLHTSNPSLISQSVGGVGHNVALAAHRVSEEGKVRLCSMVGDDIAGSTILSSIASSGLDTSYIRKLGHEYPATRTAQYVAINDAQKNLVLAMADMAIFSQHSFPTYWDSAVAAARPKWLVVDANWSSPDLLSWISSGRRHGSYIAFEPVSAAKSERLFAPPARDSPPKLGLYPHSSLDLATPNQFELAAMYAAAAQNEYLEYPGWFDIIDSFGMRGARDRFVRLTSNSITDAGIPIQSVQLLPYIPTIITKMGANGALLTQLLSVDDKRLKDPNEARYILARTDGSHACVGGIYMRMYPAVERVNDVVSVNGVGDTFLGVLVAGLAQGGRVEELVDVAQRAAVLSLRVGESVSAEVGGLRGEVGRGGRLC